MSRKEAEPITVVDTINTESKETYEFRFKTDGVITGVEVSTYVGQEFDLQYTFEVERDGEGQTYNLLNPLGKEFVAGNGENMSFNTRTSVSRNDTLVVTVENKDDEHQYHANAIIPVDYDAIDGLVSALREVL